MPVSKQTLRCEIESSERRLKSIVDAVPGVLYIAVPEGSLYRCIFVSPQIEDKLGFTAEEWIANPRLWIDQLYEEDRDRLLDSLASLTATQDVFEYECRIWTRNRRSLRWYHDTVRVERDADGNPLQFVGMIADITERKRSEEKLARYQERIREAQQQTIIALARMTSTRDPYTHGHQERVSELAVAIGAEMGLDERRLEGLRFGARIHDIGKVYIPAEILNRPGRLTAPEFELIKTHAQVGYEMVRDIDFPWPIREIILQHHERLDGSGYPHGLAGDEICLEARIVSIADTVDAMTAHRPYRPALGLDAALAEIERGAGRIYDAGAAAACHSVCSNRSLSLDEVLAAQRRAPAPPPINQETLETGPGTPAFVC